MIELFRHIPEVSVGTLTAGQWPFIQKGLQQNIQKVQAYNRTYNKAVKSNHFLVRLLQSIAVPKSMALERYYANVDAIGLNASMAMRMTSSIYHGAVFRGIFYGASMPEILLATDDYFDFNEVHENWETVCAVTPLMHAKSDLGIHLPDGQSYSDERGITVVLINVAMLAVQYRAFLLNEQKNEDESPKSIMQFIGGYVLPNMLNAQMEICLFNRIYKSALGLDDGRNRVNRKHPYALPYYDGHVDLAIGKTLEYVSRSNLKFETILKHLPSVTNKNLYESLLMPDIAPTRQVDFALVLARLKVVDFLFKTCGSQLLAKNQMAVNQILRTFRVNDVYGVFKENLPADLFFEAQDYIDGFLSAAERKTF